MIRLVNDMPYHMLLFIMFERSISVLRFQDPVCVYYLIDIVIRIEGDIIAFLWTWIAVVI